MPDESKGNPAAERDRVSDGLPDLISPGKLACRKACCSGGNLLSRIIGAAILPTTDERWDGERAEDTDYIHHLVTDTGVPGAGKRLLSEIERYSAESGESRICLDCAEDHVFLNSYYDSLGYHAVGRCREGSYVGVKREKRLRTVFA